MDWVLWITMLYLGIVCFLQYYFLCRFTNTVCRPVICAAYVLMSCGLAFYRYNLWLGGLTHLILGLMLLIGCGMLFQKLRFVDAAIPALLAVSMENAVTGTVSSAVFWVLSFSYSPMFIFFMNIFPQAATLVLLALIFRAVSRSFGASALRVYKPVLLALLVPVLFIIIVNLFISSSVYGNSVTISTDEGVISPVVNSMQVIPLRLLACACLFSVLTVYKRLVLSMEKEKQIQMQTLYVNETRLRYEQTRSFRHDIRNHLLVLRQLLLNGEADTAREYLSKLEDFSDTMSFPAQTGSAAVDALLGSRLKAAEGKGFTVECALRLPESCGISDVDWCIVLSNAIDNAIRAGAELNEKDRTLNISGNRQGNLFFLSVTNRCRKNTKIPADGVGLSNIKAVVNKYGGKTDIEVSGGIFTLGLLFMLPQYTASRHKLSPICQ